MKKLAIVGAMLMVIGVTSCSKDYDCTCDYNTGLSDTTVVTKFEDADKEEAEEACDVLQALFQIGDSTAACTLD